jgi:DHA1 family multidrug resistance protein-like MFS transporter
VTDTAVGSAPGQHESREQREQRELRRVRRWFGFLLSEWSVSNVGYYAVQSILSLYFLTSLRLSPGAAGSLVLVTSIAFRLNRIFLAPLIDRLRPRTAVCCGLLVGAAGYVGLAVTRSPLLVTALLLVIGVGGATNALSVKTLAAELTPGTDSPLLRYASLSTGLNLAAATGPLIAAALYPAHSVGWVFCLAALGYAVAAVLALFVPASAHESGQRPTWRRTSRGVLADPGFRRVLLLTVVGFFLYSQLFSTLPYFVTEGLDRPGLRGSYFTLNAVLVIAGQIPLGHWLQRTARPEHRVVLAGYALFLAGFVLLWVAPRWWMAYASVTLWTCGEMLIMPTLDTMTARTLQPWQRMVGFSFAGVAMSVGDGLGGALGVALAGWLDERHRLTELYGVMALLAVVVLAVPVYRLTGSRAALAERPAPGNTRAGEAERPAGGARRPDEQPIPERPALEPPAPGQPGNEGPTREQPHREQGSS